MERLRQRLRAMPMLFVIVPFIVGIILANNFSTPLFVLCAGMVVAACGALYARPLWIAHLFSFLLVMLFGAMLVQLRQEPAATPYNRAVEMQVSIVSPIAARDGYSVAEGRIERWFDNDCWHEAADRIQLWLHCDTLNYGDKAHIVGELREHISKYGDYNALMHNRGYVGGVAVSDTQILDIEPDAVGGIRRYAIDKLGRYARDTASHSVVAGMVVGSRHSMTSTLREAYSATGLSHILAVSGLHLGVVLLVISLFLKPLRLLTYGHVVADILTVAVLWLFVVMSGASPSVVRAALMFSVLIIVKNSTGQYNPINALLFAIFVMLCYRPQMLYDISFQLSVFAVMGIVAWGAPIVRNLGFKSRIARTVTSTFIIGVVATLWTMPMVSSTFGNIPIVGVVATPVTLITAYAIVCFGVVALIFPTPFAEPFVLCAEWLASVQNMVVEWFATLPFASVEHTLSSTAVAIYYTLFVLITLALWSRKPKAKNISIDMF